jgi:hypothetical protein
MVNEIRRRMGHSGTPLDSVGLVPRVLAGLTWTTCNLRTRGGQNAVFTRPGMEK